MALLYCRKFRVLLLCHRRKSLVEELAEDVSFVPLLLGQKLMMNILKIEINYHIVQVDIRTQANVVVGVNCYSPSSWRVNQQFFNVRLLQAEKEIDYIYINTKNVLRRNAYTPSAVLLFTDDVGAGTPLFESGIPVERTNISFASRLLMSSNICLL